jgi:hypothetical protein
VLKKNAPRKRRFNVVFSNPQSEIHNPQSPYPATSANRFSTVPSLSAGRQHGAARVCRLSVVIGHFLPLGGHWGKNYFRTPAAAIVAADGRYQRA